MNSAIAQGSVGGALDAFAAAPSGRAAVYVKNGKPPIHAAGAEGQWGIVALGTNKEYDMGAESSEGYLAPFDAMQRIFRDRGNQPLTNEQKRLFSRDCFQLCPITDSLGRSIVDYLVAIEQQQQQQHGEDAQWVDNASIPGTLQYYVQRCYREQQQQHLQTYQAAACRGGFSANAIWLLLCCPVLVYLVPWLARHVR